MTTRYCRVKGCGVELNDENWEPSQRKVGNYICRDCRKEQARSYREKNSDKVRAISTVWRKANPEKNRASSTRYRRKRGHLPMSENKDSSAYLGVYVNERLIRFHFKDVTVMPYGYPGYDFICNKNMKIDGKSSCLRDDGRWLFSINRNTEADYFLCIAYDDREKLNIVHVWLIPGKDVNDHVTISISPETIHKWDKYIYDIEGFSTCCNTIKNGNQK